MKFNCFPKKQEMYLVYSNYKVFRSKLFLDLTLQEHLVSNKMVYFSGRRVNIFPISVSPFA